MSNWWISEYIPNWAAPCIQILSGHCSNSGAKLRVLVNIHCVRRFTEHRRLIHIQDVNLYGRRVFKWAETVKSRV